MASAAEQLATNMSFGAFAKASELKKRIVFTLLALIVYRFGAQIPLPGISPSALMDFFENRQDGIIGMFSTLTGGAFTQMTIFALGIFPYITASIVMQLMTAISPKIAALKKEGNAGRRKMNQYTRYLTVVITVAQAFGIVAFITGFNANLIDGWLFTFTTVVTLLGGTLFLMWLGEQITARGIGNGTSLIIFAGIVAQFPSSLFDIFNRVENGDLSPIMLIVILLGLVAIFGFIVYFERAQRRVIINYPRQSHAQSFQQQQSSHIPLKLNTAGVIPPIFAMSLLSMPQLILTGVAAGNSAPWLQTLLVWLGPGRPLYYVLSATLIIFFTFFYTSIVFNPEETADNLKRNGGFIPGIRPGKETEKYFDYVLTRLAAVGAMYLVFVTALPEAVRGPLGINFALGGTSLLIIVSVTMDTITQVQSHLLAQQYEGLMKRAKISGKGRGKGKRR